MNLAQSQPCACPVPLSHLLRMMDTPPDFKPTRNVRTIQVVMGDEHHYPSVRQPNTTMVAMRAKYLSALSKTEWRGSARIASITGVSQLSVGRALNSKYLAGLVKRKDATHPHGVMHLWRLK